MFLLPSTYCSRVHYRTSTIVTRKDIKYAAVIKESNFNEGGFYRRRGEREETGIS